MRTAGVTQDDACSSIGARVRRLLTTIVVHLASYASLMAVMGWAVGALGPYYRTHFDDGNTSRYDRDRARELVHEDMGQHFYSRSRWGATGGVTLGALLIAGHHLKRRKAVRAEQRNRRDTRESDTASAPGSTPRRGGHFTER